MENLPKQILLGTLIFFIFFSLDEAGRDVELSQKKYKLPEGLHQIGGDTKIVVPTGPDPIHDRSEGQIRTGFQPDRKILVPTGPDPIHDRSEGQIRTGFQPDRKILVPTGPDPIHDRSEGQIRTGFQPERIVPGGPNSDHN